MNRRKPSFFDKVIGFITGKKAETVAQSGDSFLEKLTQSAKPSKKTPTRKPSQKSSKPSTPKAKPTIEKRPAAIPKESPISAVPSDRIKDYKMSAASMDELKSIWSDPTKPYSVRRQAAEIYADIAPAPLKYIIQNTSDWQAFREVYDQSES